jgi:hypothetical protein
MAGKLTTVSQKDKRYLQAMFKWYQKQTTNTQGRGTTPEQEQTAPDVYVAFVPASGIPGITEGITGSPFDDEIHGVVCPIYRLNYSTTAFDLVPERVGVKEEIVYNLSVHDIQGSRWAVVVREKFGKWITHPVVLPSGLTTTWRGVSFIECDGVLIVTYDDLVFEDGLLVEIIYDVT